MWKFRRQVRYIIDFEDVFTASTSTAWQLKMASDNTTVTSGTLSLVKDYDADVSGERVFKADFSDYTTAGEYYVSVSPSGVANSPKFEIGTDVYDNLLTDVLKYFYYQRAGVELTSKNAGTYAHELWHSNLNNINIKGTSSYKDVTGGW